MSSSEQLKNIVIDALEDIKAQDVTVMDVRDKTSITDYMIVASGTSTRHLKAIANNVEEDAKEKGFNALGQEGESGSEWILLDFGDLVLHIMSPQTRAFYDLERLWQGASPDSAAQN